MAEKINRRVMITKRMLKDAFVELLTQKSIYEISVRELCEHANINRTTFYKYYGSQFELLSDMENDMLSLVSNAISKNSEKDVMIVRTACQYLEDNLELSRLLLNNNIDTQFPEKIFSLTLVKQEVMKYIGSGYTESETGYLYAFLAYGVYQLFRTWINKENRESPEQIAKLIIKLFNNNSTQAIIGV